MQASTERASESKLTLETSRKDLQIGTVVQHITVSLPISIPESKSSTEKGRDKKTNATGLSYPSL